MIHTILGFFNRDQREQIALASGDDGFIITSDWFTRPVIAPTASFVEQGDEAFKQIGHGGAMISWWFKVQGKGEV
jgi:hypothetical protein